VEYYSGLPYEIVQCAACGCRSTRSDPEIYDRLYSEQKSIYGIYDEASARVETLFKRGDLLGLQSVLKQSPKYNFVISHAMHLPLSAKVLEIGASRGHLASFFILRGNKVVGADVSREAARRANETFGQHFHHIDSPEIAGNAPYDLIYHVGTIGCVPDPVGLTKNLLGMLALGGLLAFNAPLLEACYLKGQLWIDESNPPDLVTLFPADFLREPSELKLKWSRGSTILAPAKIFASRSAGLSADGTSRHRFHSTAACQIIRPGVAQRRSLNGQS
jgi:hypothetical protein